MSEFVTLAQARLVVGDDVDRKVYDEFVKSNALLSRIPFHSAAALTGGGAAAYTYNAVTVQPEGGFRALGADYTAQAAEVEQRTVVCKALGGSYKIDRIVAGLGAAAEVTLQTSQKVKAARAAFNDAFINGDAAVDAASFDGLSKLLTGTDTEIDGSGIDFMPGDLYAPYDTTSAAAFKVLSALDDLISEVDGDENVILVANKTTLARIRNAARIAGYRTSTEDAAGRVIDAYNGVPLVDLGSKPGTNDPIIPVTAGVSDVYVVRLGEDACHAVTPAGAPLISTRLPNADQNSAVLEGWVEMYTAIVLKSSKSAAVLRDVRVSA